MNSANSSGQRYQYLDFLRGAAALAILFAHWTVWTISSTRVPNIFDQILTFFGSAMYFGIPYSPHPGVSVFIVLSGFFIHLPFALNPQKFTNEGSWRAFAYHRIVRIAPLYWIASLMGLGALILASTYPSFAPAFVSPDVNTAGALGMIFKLSFLNGFWLSAETTLGNGPLYAVSIEMMPYAVYPLTLFIRRRFGWLGVLALSLIFLGIGIGLWLSGLLPPIWAGLSFWTFYLFWVIGAFVAEQYVKTKVGALTNPKWWRVIIMFCIYLAASYSLGFPGSQIIRATLFAMTVGFFIYSLMVSESRRGLPNKALINVLKWVADRSYSIYAVQAPVIITTMLILNALGMHYFIAERGVTWLAVFVVAWLVYILVEKPSHRLSKGIKR